MSLFNGKVMLSKMRGAKSPAARQGLAFAAIAEFLKEIADSEQLLQIHDRLTDLTEAIRPVREAP